MILENGKHADIGKQTQQEKCLSLHTVRDLDETPGYIVDRNDAEKDKQVGRDEKGVEITTRH
jgi:hypothetical protein